MQIEVFSDADVVARAAAQMLATEAKEAVAARGRFVLATSGGKTPWAMLKALVEEQVPWTGLEIVQVDERVAPVGHPDRNLTHLEECLIGRSPLRPEQIHAMPVEQPDLDDAARDYAEMVARIAGSPPAIDIVHLGLGPDGHTASLVPGDPVLEVTDRDVAISGVYQGRRRMTLTFPAINRAKGILWLVTGAEKSPMLKRLLAADPSIPAGRVRHDAAILLADRAAMESATGS
jgi:6-phosphogluconolactonase